MFYCVFESKCIQARNEAAEFCRFSSHDLSLVPVGNDLR